MKIIDHKSEVRSYIQESHLEEIVPDNYLAYVQIHIFEAMELIMNEDDYATYFYIILEGNSRVAPTSVSGKIALLDYMGPLELLGDIEYFFDEPIYHSVIALTECILLAIPYKHLDGHFGNNLAFYKFVSQSLAGKMRNSSIRQSRTLLYPVKNRLAKYLFDHCKYEHTNHITLKFNRTAEYLGITPRHFRRILSEFESEGILLRHKTKIEILEMIMLEDYCTYK